MGAGFEGEDVEEELVTEIDLPDLEGTMGRMWVNRHLCLYSCAHVSPSHSCALQTDLGLGGLFHPFGWTLP